jgi:hypothetical protein
MDHNESVSESQGHSDKTKNICSMMAGDYNTDSEKACADLVRSALSTISSPLERLIFVTSLRDPKTGDYRERVLALKFGRAEVDHVLSAEHRAIFEAWLCLNLQQQTLELEHHVSNQEAPPPAVLDEWTHQKSYQQLTPPGAMQAQRELFVTDMETILNILGRKTWLNVEQGPKKQ